MILILFAIAALMTAFFVERDALHFSVTETLIVVTLITLFVGALAFEHPPPTGQRQFN